MPVGSEGLAHLTCCLSLFLKKKPPVMGTCVILFIRNKFYLFFLICWIILEDEIPFQSASIILSFGLQIPSVLVSCKFGVWLIQMVGANIAYL